MDAGVAQVSQLGRDARAAGTLGATYRTLGPQLATLTSASLTFAGDSATAAQLIGALAWRPRVASRWSTEVGVAAAAFGVYELGRGAGGHAYLRERLSMDHFALWAGGAAGRTYRDGQTSHATVADIGGSARVDDFQASLTFSRTRSSDWALLEASQIFLTSDAPSYDLSDMTVSFRYAPGPVTIELAQNWRSGEFATAASQSALIGSAEVMISPRFALQFASGRRLADPLRGTPDATVLSLALRILAFPWRRFDAPDVSSRAFASIANMTDGVLLTVHVVAPDSQRVEVAGSFSGWEPVPLRRTADGWEARVMLRSGRHRVAVRIDAGAWKAPANLGAVRDEFGGSSGLVIVP